MLSPLTGELKSSQIFGHRLKTLAALAFVKVIAGIAFILKPEMLFLSMWKQQTLYFSYWDE